MEEFLKELEKLIQVLHDANANNILTHIMEPALELKYQLQRMDEFYKASKNVLEKK